MADLLADTDIDSNKRPHQRVICRRNGMCGHLLEPKWPICKSWWGNPKIFGKDLKASWRSCWRGPNQKKNCYFGIALMIFSVCLGWGGWGNKGHTISPPTLQTKISGWYLGRITALSLSISCGWFQPASHCFVVNIVILPGFLFQDILLGLSILKLCKNVSTKDFIPPVWYSQTISIWIIKSFLSHGHVFWSNSW